MPPLYAVGVLRDARARLIANDDLSGVAALNKALGRLPRGSRHLTAMSAIGRLATVMGEGDDVSPGEWEFGHSREDLVEAFRVAANLAPGIGLPTPELDESASTAILEPW